MRERLDVVEAIAAEASGVDKILDELWERIARAWADEDTFGLSAESEAAQPKAAPARSLTDEERAERARLKAERERRKAERDAASVADSPP